MFEHACGVGLEGVVSKVRDSRYVSGRGNDWVKKACAQRETLPADPQDAIRAIDQQTANASGAHFSEGDLLAGGAGHVIHRRCGKRSK